VVILEMASGELFTWAWTSILQISASQVVRLQASAISAQFEFEFLVGLGFELRASCLSLSFLILAIMLFKKFLM
jgi:hypothetical protein